MFDEFKKKSKKEQLNILKDEERLKTLIYNHSDHTIDLEQYLIKLDKSIKTRIISLARSDIYFMYYYYKNFNSKIIQEIIETDSKQYDEFISKLKDYIKYAPCFSNDIIRVLPVDIILCVESSIIEAVNKGNYQINKHIPRILLEDIEFVLSVIDSASIILDCISEKSLDLIFETYNGHEIIRNLIENKKYEISDNSPSIIRNNHDYVKLCIEINNNSKYIYYMDIESVTEDLIKLALSKNLKFEENVLYDINNIICQDFSMLIKQFENNLEEEYKNYLYLKQNDNNYIDIYKNIQYEGMSKKEQVLYKIITNTEYIKLVIQSGYPNIVDYIHPLMIDKEIATLAFFYNYEKGKQFKYLVWAFNDTAFLIEQGYTSAIDYETKLTDELIILALKSDYNGFFKGIHRLINSLSDPLIARELDYDIMYSLYHYGGRSKITEEVILASLENNDEVTLRLITSEQVTEKIVYKSLEKGYEEIINLCDDNLLTDEVINLYLSKNYSVKIIMQKMKYSLRLRLFFEKYFGLDIGDDKDFNELCEILSNRKKLNKNLLEFIKYNDLLMNTLNLDVSHIIKYCLSDNNIDYLNKIIVDGKLEIFLHVYLYLKNNYFNNYNYIQQLNLFFQSARNFDINPEFYIELTKRKLNLQEREAFYVVFKNPSKYSDINVDNLLKILEDKRDYIKELLEKQDYDLLNSALIDYIFNMELKEFENILNQSIDGRTLKNIINNSKSRELKYKAQVLQIQYSFMQEIYYQINNWENLKKISQIVLENDDKILSIRSLFTNINQNIRGLLELEANETLTDLNLIKHEVRKYGSETIDYIDLKEQSYTLYAHVYSGNNIKELVTPRKVGIPTICLSPITELSQRLLDDNITVGYTYIPKGSYICSSFFDMYSEIDYNTLNFKLENLPIKQFCIRDSANFSTDIPETILFREGLYPSCIIIRADEPTTEEIEAAWAINDELIRVTGQSNINIPLVRVRQLSFKSTKTTSDINLNNSQIEYLNKLHEIMNFGIERKTDFILTEIPLTHSGRKTIIQISNNNEYYFLKENAFGAKLGYLIQSLVRDIAFKVSSHPEELNINSAVEMEIVELPYNVVDKDSNCKKIEKFALRKISNNTTSYYDCGKEFTTKEIRQLMLEFIVDYLILNNNHKYSNFLYDNEFNVYGIDKHKALLAKPNDGFCFHRYVSWSNNSIYYEVFTEYEIEESIIEDCCNVVECISNMTDEEYLSYCEDFINLCNDKDREVYISKILIRKDKLRSDFGDFLITIEDSVKKYKK